MADSNRVRFAECPEITVGTFPGSNPRFRTIALTGESLKYSPTFFTPNTMRADRMNIAPTPINDQNSGGINFEAIYPEAPRYLDDFYESGFQSVWINNAERFNDGVASSVITAVTATTFTFLTAPTPFVASQLVWTSGFGVPQNNGLFKATAGSATSITVAGAAAEATPPGTARIKDVGFEGASGDIAATFTASVPALTSADLDFTTLGMIVGQWIEIGGAALANQFIINPANRGYARIVTIAAHTLTLDNAPTGWAADAGTGRTIRVFYGDVLRNGTTPLGLSIERAFLDQTTPSYILQSGMVVDTMTFTAVSEAAILQTVTFMGMKGSDSTTPNSTPITNYDAAPNERVFTANVSVGRISEAGAPVITPNFVRQLDWTINNNLREDTALGTRGAIRIGSGDSLVTGTLATYFGNNVLLDKIRAGQISSLSARASAPNTYVGTGNTFVVSNQGAVGSGQRAVVWSFPQVTFTGGDPTATGKNVSIVIPMTWQSSIWTDPSAPTITYQAQVDRFPYVEETGAL